MTAHAHAEDHHHDHDHHNAPPPEIEARVRAIESLLVERGIIDHSAIDAVVETYENDLGPMIGARLVARAWKDPEFRQRLIDDTSAVVREVGHAGLEATHIVAVPNDETTHNIVVCTLCSCYPWALLGLPPKWYKSNEYRSKVVAEPRKLLEEEFDIVLDEGVKLTVWDSSADVRYFVLPMAPPGIEDLSEEEAAALVTRDSMIGVGFPATPAAAGAGA